jgi:RimJ/RimL family protein N-acetyltransferase
MRPLGRGYVADLVELYADPAVTEFLAPLDEAGHLRRCLEAEQMWAGRGYGRAAFHDRADGRFVGRGGLQYWPHFDEVEVTWALRRDAWGRGLATEAGEAWLRWGLERLDVPYITAFVAPENIGSRAVAERLGMSVLRTDTQHGREVLVYARHRVDMGGGDD